MDQKRKSVGSANRRGKTSARVTRNKRTGEKTVSYGPGRPGRSSNRRGATSGVGSVNRRGATSGNRSSSRRSPGTGGRSVKRR